MICVHVECTHVCTSACIHEDMYSGQSRKFYVLICHFLPHSLETGSLMEPGAHRMVYAGWPESTWTPPASASSAQAALASFYVDVEY